MSLRSLWTSFSNFPVNTTCKWKFIPREIFKYIPTLNHIEIKDNTIERIEKDDFDGAKVHKLEIVGNSIHELGPNVFEHLKKTLNYTDLSNNKIEFIHQNAFESLSKLLYLNLTGNNLFMVHEISFNGLTKMLSLNLTKNVCLNDVYDSSHVKSELPRLIVKQGCHLSYMKRLKYDEKNEQRVSLNISILCNVCSFIFSALIIVSSVLVLKFVVKTKWNSKIIFWLRSLLTFMLILFYAI